MADIVSSFHSSAGYSGAALRAETACAELRDAAAIVRRPLPPATLCEELHTAVERAAEKSTESMHELRRAVAKFTVALRGEGAQPEAVLIALKSVINSRTFPIPRDYTPDSSTDALRQQISAWSIEEFFRQPQA